MPRVRSRRRNPPRRFTPSAYNLPDGPGTRTPSTSAWEVTPMRPTTRRDPSPVPDPREPEDYVPDDYVQQLEQRLSALESMSPMGNSAPTQNTTTQGECPVTQNVMQNVISSHSLPLYASLPRDTQEGIERGEFIELGALAPSNVPTHDGKKLQKKPLTPLGWARAYIRLASEMVRQGKADSQDLLIHMDNVLGLAEERHKWEEYDRSFRSQQVNASYSFAQMRVELYAKAVTPRQLFRPGNNQGQRPSNAQRLPMGSCFRFHTANQRCEAVQCQYSHNCPGCGGRHPRYLCAKEKGGRSNNQQQQSNTQQGDQRGSK